MHVAKKSTCALPIAHPWLPGVIYVKLHYAQCYEYYFCGHCGLAEGGGCRLLQALRFLEMGITILLQYTSQVIIATQLFQLCLVFVIPKLGALACVALPFPLPQVCFQLYST